MYDYFESEIDGDLDDTLDMDLDSELDDTFDSDIDSELDDDFESEIDEDVDETDETDETEETGEETSEDGQEDTDETSEEDEDVDDLKYNDLLNEYKTYKGVPNIGRQFVDIETGEKTTYVAAVDRMTNYAEGLLRKINPNLTDEDIDRFKAHVSNNLFKLQHYTDERLLGEHGIKHMYGNFERFINMNCNDGSTAEDNLATFIAIVHHDDGYTGHEIHDYGVALTSEERAKLPPQKRAESYHGVISDEIFDNEHAQFYSKYLSKDKIEDIKYAIVAHNESGYDLADKSKPALDKMGTERKVSDIVDASVNPDEAKYTYNGKEISESARAIAAKLAIVDKLALDEREKKPDAYLNNIGENTQLQDLSYKMYLIGKYEKDISSDLGSSAEVEEIRKAALFKAESIADTIVVSDDSTENKEYREALKKAIRKDFTPGGAKFNLGMNYIQIPADSVSMNKDDKGIYHTEIRINTIDSDVTDSPEKYRQFKKFFEDMGYNFENDDDKNLLKSTGCESVKAFISSIENGGEVELPQSHTRVIVERSDNKDESYMISRESFERAKECVEREYNSLLRSYIDDFSRIERINEISDKDSKRFISEMFYEIRNGNDGSDAYRKNRTNLDNLVSELKRNRKGSLTKKDIGIIVNSSAFKNLKVIIFRNKLIKKVIE